KPPTFEFRNVVLDDNYPDACTQATSAITGEYSFVWSSNGQCREIMARGRERAVFRFYIVTTEPPPVCHSGLRRALVPSPATAGYGIEDVGAGAASALAKSGLSFPSERAEGE
ncbi:unnamed protein product, partial [Phaeothamnion confervicola]